METIFAFFIRLLVFYPVPTLILLALLVYFIFK